MRSRNAFVLACLVALLVPASALADRPDDVRAYWTSERMKNAKPKENARAGKGKPGGGSAGFSSGAVATNDPAYSTVGKVFFTEAGVNYVCSGTTVPGKTAVYVWTAGHCVNEGPGDYVTNFMFAPGYYNGQTPYGKWAATELKTSEQWRTSGDFTYDFGIARLARPSDTTSTPTAWPMSFNYTVDLGSTTFTSYGYPAAGKFNGQTMRFCTSAVQRWDTAPGDPMAIGCDMTGGSSGGGWVNGSKQVVSLNSYGYQGLKNTMFGPFQGGVAKTLYDGFAT